MQRILGVWIYAKEIIFPALILTCQYSAAQEIGVFNEDFPSSLSLFQSYQCKRHNSSEHQSLELVVCNQFLYPLHNQNHWGIQAQNKFPQTTYFDSKKIKGWPISLFSKSIFIFITCHFWHEDMFWLIHKHDISYVDDEELNIAVRPRHTSLMCRLA